MTTPHASTRCSRERPAGRLGDRPGGRRRDPVTVLFAAALGDDRDAEDALRAAAQINDRAADAL